MKQNAPAAMRFLKELQKIAPGNTRLLGMLRDSYALNPFFANNLNDSELFRVDCADSSSRKVITKAVNRIFNTSYDRVYYIHLPDLNEKPDKWREECKSENRYTPRIRCGPMQSWQIKNHPRPHILSLVTDHMTNDLESIKGNSVGYYTKLVQNQFNRLMWKRLHRNVREFFARFYGERADKQNKDATYKVGLLVMRCLVLAVMDEESLFQKYRPLLFAIRSGIPLETHPHQNTYLTVLTR